MLSPKHKRIFLQIVPFGLISLAFSIMYSLLEKGILGDYPIYPSTGNPYNFEFIVPAIISLILGLFIGVFEVLFLSKRFQKGSLGKKIIFKTVVYLFIITIALLIIITLTNAYELGVSPLDKEVWDNFILFFSDFAFWTILLYFSMAVVLCLFYNEVSDNIGQAVLLNFFTGKYHQPIEEERVFMFLDMKSSTTIAEQLGHVQYFKMLTEYYKDLSDAIIQYGGEIYQYVGDEVVVTWKLKKGFAPNCLNCFFAMKAALAHRAPKYQSKYEVTPTFKAGIHFGKVTTGEIGVIKKEIIFSGDVLNTTARIQGLCNTYGVDVLVSERLIQELDGGEAFRPKVLGETKLRGRNEKINLFTIEKQA
ncbi:adenylate/guanylate cyclase domain-containing protein [Spongiimicrobium salis]|uniref:adenylate/guanylate cyclase domain-containing protein n=1 Tax=Spongiimicrobium salis TaxID=1667022 RepID=UPI00374D4C51